MDSLFSALRYIDIFQRPLRLNFDDGQVMQSMNGICQMRDADDPLNLRKPGQLKGKATHSNLFNRKDLNSDLEIVGNSNHFEGGTHAVKEELERRLKVGYQDGTVFGGLLTIIAATLVVLYAISRVNRADAHSEIIDSLAAVGGLAYLIVVAFDGVW